MRLKGKPNRVINRFGNKYIADENGYLEATTDEELELFVLYGYELEGSVKIDMLQNIANDLRNVLEESKEVLEEEVNNEAEKKRGRPKKDLEFNQ